jgi:hypothetical protein
MKYYSFRIAREGEEIQSSSETGLPGSLPFQNAQNALIFLGDC